MKHFIFYPGLFLLVLNVQACSEPTKNQIIFHAAMSDQPTILPDSAQESVYQFQVNDLYGKPVSLEQFKGKVLLIVNTASECGLTPQLKGLESLYQTYKDKGLVVLGFPSNDFGGQEPLEGEAIGAFCTKNYGVSFPIFEKVQVKGDDACPLYQFLGNRSRNGKVSAKPMWNFHKYLVDREGKVQDYFISTTSPDSEKVHKAIEALL